MSLLLSLLLKPLVAVLVLVPVRVATEVLRKYMSESRLKQALFSPLPGHRGRR